MKIFLRFFLIVFLLVTVSCSEADQTSNSFIYVLQGGIAGYDREVSIALDGQAMVHDYEEVKIVNLTKSDFSKLMEAFNSIDKSLLQSSPPTPTDECCDMTYAYIGFNGKYIDFEDVTYQVVQDINAIIDPLFMYSEDISE